MAKKVMSTSVKRSAITGRFMVAKGRERLTDSITGSLRVEGYAVKREAVAKAVSQRKK